MIEELEIPFEAISTVIDWIKSEQIRVINKDRTLGLNKIQKLDWLTETINSLGMLQSHAKADNDKIVAGNELSTRIKAREEAAKNCRCQPGCTCQAPLPSAW